MYTSIIFSVTASEGVGLEVIDYPPNRLSLTPISRAMDLMDAVGAYVPVSGLHSLNIILGPDWFSAFTTLPFYNEGHPLGVSSLKVEKFFCIR